MPDPPLYAREDILRRLLTQLDGLLEQRNHTERGADLDALDVQIVSLMNRIGDAYGNAMPNDNHADQERARQWYDTARNFGEGEEQEKENILMPIAKGLGIIIATPFALAGGVVFAAGAILYGAGRVVQGIGNLLTFGTLR